MERKLGIFCLYVCSSIALAGVLISLLNMGKQNVEVWTNSSQLIKSKDLQHLHLNISSHLFKD